MPFNINLQLDSTTLTPLQNITAVYDSLESAIMSLYADCREKSLAITNLEQSHMWLVKMVERSQLEQNFRSGQSMPQPKTEIKQPVPPSPPLSADAKLLAESRAGLDTLIDSIKDLTDSVAVKGFPPITK